MKLKKEYIILAVLLVGLVVYLIFNANRSGDINYKLPKLTKIGSKEIDKIEITRGGNTITLAFDKKTDTWRIMPQEYPADKTAMDNMLKQIDDLQLSELISDKKIYDKYNLDQDNKINVLAMQGDKTLRNFDVGKVTDVSSHTFVKLADNPNVYTVKSNIRSTFEKTADDMRDKVVLNVNKDSVQEIDITYKGENIVLKKKVLPKEKETDPEKTEWQIEGSDKKVKQTEIDDIFNGAVNLVCDSYIPEDQKVDFTDPYFTIVFKGDKEYRLSAMEQKQDNMHPAISSESAYQFNLISWKMNRLMKTTDDLVEKEK